jgi:hypothetical protein
MKISARYLLALLAVTVISTHAAFAFTVPEIDPAMGTGALALLGGAIMVIRGRTKGKAS